VVVVVVVQQATIQDASQFQILDAELIGHLQRARVDEPHELVDDR
jgi:hypothetical protein